MSQEAVYAIGAVLKTLVDPLRRTVTHHNYQSNDDQTQQQRDYILAREDFAPH